MPRALRARHGRRWCTANGRPRLVPRRRGSTRSCRKHRSERARFQRAEVQAPAGRVDRPWSHRAIEAVRRRVRPRTAGSRRPPPSHDYPAGTGCPGSRSHRSPAGMGASSDAGGEPTSSWLSVRGRTVRV
jgi:hypothetical protein